MRLLVLVRATPFFLRRDAVVTWRREHSFVLLETMPLRDPSRFNRAPAAPRAARRMTMTGALLADTLLTGAVGAPRGPAASAARLKWLCENVCAVHALDVRVTGTLPRGPAALVANHVSYLDPVAVASLVPLTAIAKEEVRDWPLIGRALRELGLLFVRRGDAASGARTLRAAARAFEAGLGVLTFPEGTTTSGDRVLPFKRGVFGLAARMSIPIVPITVRYDDPGVPWVGDDAFLPHYLRTARRAVTRVTLHFDAPLLVRKNDRPEDLAARARRSIAERLCEPSSRNSSSSAA